MLQRMLQKMLQRLLQLKIHKLLFGILIVTIASTIKYYFLIDSTDLGANILIGITCVSIKLYIFDIIEGFLVKHEVDFNLGQVFWGPQYMCGGKEDIKLSDKKDLDNSVLFMNNNPGIPQGGNNPGIAQGGNNPGIPQGGRRLAPENFQPTPDFFEHTWNNKRFKKIEFMFCVQNKYEAFQNYSTQQKLNTLDTCIDRLSGANARATIHYDDLAVVKSLANLNMLSQQTKDILKGLGNGDVIGPSNKVSCDWTQGGSRNKVREDLIRNRTNYMNHLNLGPGPAPITGLAPVPALAPALAPGNAAQGNVILSNPVIGAPGNGAQGIVLNAGDNVNILNTNVIGNSSNNNNPNLSQTDPNVITISSSDNSPNLTQTDPNVIASSSNEDRTLNTDVIQAVPQNLNEESEDSDLYGPAPDIPKSNRREFDEESEDSDLYGPAPDIPKSNKRKFDEVSQQEASQGESSQQQSLASSSNNNRTLVANNSPILSQTDPNVWKSLDSDSDSNPRQHKRPKISSDPTGNSK